MTRNARILIGMLILAIFVIITFSFPIYLNIRMKYNNKVIHCKKDNNGRKIYEKYRSGSFREWIYDTDGYTTEIYSQASGKFEISYVEIQRYDSKHRLIYQEFYSVEEDIHSWHKKIYNKKGDVIAEQSQSNAFAKNLDCDS